MLLAIADHILSQLFFSCLHAEMLYVKVFASPIFYISCAYLPPAYDAFAVSALIMVIPFVMLAVLMITYSRETLTPRTLIGILYPLPIQFL